MALRARLPRIKQLAGRLKAGRLWDAPALDDAPKCSTYVRKPVQERRDELESAGVWHGMTGQVTTQISSLLRSTRTLFQGSSQLIEGFTQMDIFLRVSRMRLEATRMFDERLKIFAAECQLERHGEV